MNNYPMVEAVNRLVANRLAEGGDLFLPGVGSLYVDRRGAQRVSRRRIDPPSRFIVYTSQERGVSLVDEIVRIAQCDLVQAQDVYNRWLASVQQGDRVQIEGVGVLKSKNFTLDPVFDVVLNPSGHKSLIVKSSNSDWVLWIGVAAIIIAGVIVCSQFLPNYSLSRFIPWSQSEKPTLARVERPAAKSVERVEVVDVDATALSDTAATLQIPAETPKVEAPVAKPEPTPAPKAELTASRTASGTTSVPAHMQPGRKYVVLGVFSTAANAARASMEAQAKNASLQCQIYLFGTKYMVSPFEGADAANCDRFIATHSDSFPALWIHTAR